MVMDDNDCLEVNHIILHQIIKTLKNTSTLFFFSGVADGVGGWRTYGIDPSLFSNTLMRTCERLVTMGRFNARSPSSIIANSYYELMESKEQIIGEIVKLGVYILVVWFCRAL